jgi:hypothetical protein
VLGRGGLAMGLADARGSMPGEGGCRVRGRDREDREQRGSGGSGAGRRQGSTAPADPPPIGALGTLAESEHDEPPFPRDDA